MKLPHRRHVIYLAAGAAALSAMSRIAKAQTYPNKFVRLVVPFQAGGQIDIVGRIISQWLSERLGQQFVVDNRPGAGSNIGTEAVIRAPADGYTLLMVGSSSAINATLYDNLKFNFIRDTVPVASINRIPHVLEAHPSFFAKTVPELIAYAKSNPGKVSVATTPKGTGPYMTAELFRMMTGIDVVLVPYRAEAQMLTDLLGSQVQVAFGATSAALEHIKAGKLRALGVASAARLAMLPDVPTIGDTVAGFEASGWSGIVAPRNTPVEIVEKLHNEINAGLAEPKMAARLVDVGVTVFATSSAQFAKHIAEETEKWAKVIKFAGIKAD
jgi:tripartite-type tricarboxylate transporter receptor subunit TctC